MPTRRSLHDSDFYAWSLEQAALLRAGGVGDVDLAAIAEEIESMGKTEKRELISRLTVLLLPLLKWQRQPGGRGNSWRLSIADARDEIANSSPTIQAERPSSTRRASSYRYARRKAAIETDLAEETFPAQCPWSFAEAVDAGFWPE